MTLFPDFVADLHRKQLPLPNSLLNSWNVMLAMFTGGIAAGEGDRRKNCNPASSNYKSIQFATRRNMHPTAFLPTSSFSPTKEAQFRPRSDPLRLSPTGSVDPSSSQAASASSSTPSAAVIAARRLRDAHVSHASALRDQLLSRVAESMAQVLTAGATEELHAAIAAAADARARAEAATRTIASVRDSAVASTSILHKKLGHEQAARSALEKQVQYLLNAIKEKDRALARSNVATRDGEASSDVSKHTHNGHHAHDLSTEAVNSRSSTVAIQCSVDAQACLSSLLLYPCLVETFDNINLPPPQTSRSYRERPVPEFYVALQGYLEAISPYSQNVNPARALAAYTDLWRSVAAPGRRGWRGEIIQIALSKGSSELISSALVSPDSRRALISDLRVLQSLHCTPVSTVASWLGQNVGVTPPPLTLPEYGTADSTVQSEQILVPVDSPAENTDSADKANTWQELVRVLDEAPDWGNENVVDAVLQNFLKGASQSASLVESYYGLRWCVDGTLEGVLSAKDVQELPEYHFVGIEQIRNRLCQNCDFLLHDLTASNVHIWGPPGSGKSSCVMSLLKQFGPRGLRIIEVSKQTLANLPDIFGMIGKLSQKFIVFIDDLTFEEHESEDMRLAKAALEGSLRMNPKNVFVLCTSNRRFPVGSRLTDSNEEKLAFSYRFGIVLAFPRTTRDAYLRIVHTLAKERGIVLPEEELNEIALKWALGQDGNSNSLSGRTARQFVDHVSSTQALNGMGVGEEYLILTGNENASAIPANSLWATENAYHIQR